MTEPPIRGPEPVTPDDELAREDDTIIAKAFWWSVAVFVGLGVIVGGVLYFNRSDAPEEVIVEKDPDPPAPLVTTEIPFPVLPFEDITAAAGIDFVHESGARGEKLLPETMGGGCAFFDYDGDGDEDLLLVNGRPWPHDDASARTRSGLYRNDGTGRFEDVTIEAGLDDVMYGFGPAVGDVDNDGDPDLFIACLGRDRMYRNDDGVFVDVTETSGLGGPDDAWSSSATFLDYDNDGRLDLFVCTYIEWSRDIDIDLGFTMNGVDRAYGPPNQYRGTNSRLHRNVGDGVFEDVSAEAGVQVANRFSGEPMGKALAVLAADVDHDGWTDLLVANDTVENFFFRNTGEGGFEELGASSGLAVANTGVATAAMGIDAATYRNDETMAVAIGNFAREMTSFYVSTDGQLWTDEAIGEGVGSPSRQRLSFGVFFFDYDLDGRPDLLQANGHLEDTIAQVDPSQTYRQPTQLFWNRGPEARSAFAEAPAETIGDLATPIVGRGAAHADIDGDGDLDVLLTQTGDAPLLLRNAAAETLGHHWLRVRLEGVRANREGIGAWIELEADGVVQRRCVTRGRSYLSQTPASVTFGLGDETDAARLTVIWPGGQRQDVAIEGVDREIVVRQADTDGDA